jgi:hypothetical protein
LKISSLLAQYLKNNKRLDLTGIGTFILSQTENSEPENHKSERKTGLGGIIFETNVSLNQNPDLIQFIAEHTGKIKALAAADLESHLSQARQFLNIGNPFIFEGIGILEKNKSGKFILKKESGTQEKEKEISIPEDSIIQDAEKSSYDFKKILYYDKIKTQWRKPIAALLILAGLALAVWGGYTVYKRTSAKQNADVKVKKNKTSPVVDKNQNPKDSIILSAQVTQLGTQKFILEESNATRAFERYGRLKTFLWDVHMETKDSITYKLFMLLPASAGDTSRIIDSLSLLSGKKVYLEK